MQDIKPELFGNGIDELALFFHEWPFVRSRPLFSVIHANLPYVLVLNVDAGALNPVRLSKSQRLKCLTVVGNFRLAYVRVLPPGGQHLDDTLADLVHGDFGLAQQLLHLVEAVQLLGSLFQLVD